MLKKNHNFTIYIPSIAYLLSSLFNGDNNNIVIFGGYVRDYIINKLTKEYLHPYDLDVVVLYANILNNYTRSTNRFNGNTIFIYNTRIDFWELKDTLSLINNNRSISFDKLPETTVFNCNSIAYDIKTGKLYEYAFFKSLETRTIDFNDISYLYNFQELQAVRAYYLSKKLKFKLSNDVTDFLYTTLTHSTYSIIATKIYNSKYDNFKLIWNLYSDIFSSKRYNKSYCDKYILNKFFKDTITIPMSQFLSTGKL